MSKHARDNRPYVKPVTRIDLSGDHFTLRWILLVLAIAVAVTCLVSGVSSMIETAEGWHQIEVTSDQRNCSQDFQLFYELGAAGESATVENKRLSALYSQATEDAYLIFTAYESGTDTGNLHTLNQHPNEAVTVDPVLYQALEKLAASGDRSIFLAAVYGEYEQVFRSASDAEAAAVDPMRDAQAEEYVRMLASFASDPEMIRLELLDGCQVRLVVDQEYLDLAADQELELLVDLSWMTNAFIIDYLADILVSNGYTNGYLVSTDGFTRNLDDRGTEYGQDILDYREGTIYVPAHLRYTGARSMVYLRSYPVSMEDSWRYYRYENGDVTSVHIGMDGRSKASTSDLLAYTAGDQGCADLLLKLMPLYIAESFDGEAVDALTQQGIFSIYTQGTTVYCNDPTAAISLTEGESTYTLEMK